MRGVNYQFSSFEDLSLVLEAGGDEQDLELPRNPDGSEADCRLGDCEWVLATFSVGEEMISIAACAVDRGAGLRLAFEDRDWQKLWNFANQAGPPSLPPSIPPPPSSELQELGGKILIIDDNLETRELTKGLLSASGYDVSCVGSAEQAFDWLRGQPVDLVLLESALPGMSGTDFCRRVRRDRRFRSLPLVFLSTRSSSEDVVRAFASGADDYVTKPFKAPELVARVLGLLRRSRMPAHETSSEAR